MPLNGLGQGSHLFYLTLCLVEVATSYNTEFQKDTLEGLQNPFSNSGDIKMAKKALELTFSDFNH